MTNSEILTLLNETFTLAECATDETLFPIICRQLRKFVKACFTIIAVRDKGNFFTIKNQDREPWFDAPENFNSFLLTETSIEDLQNNRIKMCDSQDEVITCLIPPELINSNKNSGNDQYYRFSFVIEGNIYAVATVCFEQGNTIPDIFMVKSFLNLTGLFIQRLSEKTKLIKNEEKYRYVVETIKDVIITVTPEGIIEYCSSSMREFGGYISEEEIGQPVSKYFANKLELFMMLGLLKKTNMDQQSSTIEFLFQAKSKEPFYVEVNTQPIVKDNKIISIQCMLRDTSERRKAEEALIRSEVKYRSLIENIVVGIFRISLEADKQNLQLNSAMVKLFGYDSLKEMAEIPLTSHFINDSERQAFINEIKDKGNVKDKVLYLRKKDSTPFWVSCSAKVSYDENNEIKWIDGVMQDNTERMNAMVALKESEEKFRAITSSAKDAIIIIDPEEKIEYWNDAAEKMFGYKEKEMIGQSLHKILLLDDMHKNYLATFLGDGVSSDHYSEGKTFEVLASRADSHLLPVEISLSLANIKDKKHGAGFIRDISERKRVEAEIKQHKDHLEDLVVARTTALLEMNEQLTASKEKAETASTAKSEFLANMSHEIRTPINGIIGLSGLLLDSNLSEEQLDQVQMISFSADSLLNLINDILDFSKIEAGQMNLENIAYDLRFIIEFTIESLKYLAKEKNLSLTFNIDENIPKYLISDPERLKQIILNLCYNAIKFTETGGVVLNCQVEDRPSPDEIMLHFSISDTGIGIAPDKTELIFESFRQSDSSVTRKYGGTGLGLTICQRLTQIMGGNIWVESTLGVGSTFHFTIKCRVPDEEQMKQIDAEKNKSADSTVMNKKIHILLVEDHPINQKMGMKMLEKNGYLVSLAPNGVEAVDLCREKNYDIVLMDVQMPVMDGVKATQIIREYEKQTGQHVPIIAVTANAMKGDREKYLEAGMDDYIAKPIRREDLYRIIDRYVHKTDIHQDNKLQILVAENFEPDQEAVKSALSSEACELFLVDNGITALESLNAKKYDLVLMDTDMPGMDGFTATTQIREKNKDIPVLCLMYQPDDNLKKRCQESGMNGYVEKPIQKDALIAEINKYVKLNSTGQENSKPEKTDADKLTLDYEKALSEFDNDKEFLIDLIKNFIEITYQQADKIKVGLDTNNYQLIKENAHSIKGGAANLCATNLSKAAANLEQMAKNSKIENGLENFHNLVQYIKELGNYYKRVIN
ncbi:MAG: response regulator [Candidatus Margulisbacteria bacterium]|nr:response regulator [Candidatus Margulisiibacteriota bacterium]